jgi:hypothetical protein
MDETLRRRFLEAGLAEVDAYTDPEVFLVRRADEVTEDVLERLVRAEVEAIEVYSSAAFISTRGSYEDLTMRRDWSQQPTLAADVVDPKTGEIVAEKGETFDVELFGASRSAGSATRSCSRAARGASRR